MHSKAKTVRQYLGELPAARRGSVNKLCQLIKKHTPRVEETMEHKMPFYKLDGQPYIAVASQKHHVSLYVVGLDDTLTQSRELGKAFSWVDKGKNCLRFRKSQLGRIPFPFVEKLIKVTRGKRAST